MAINSAKGTLGEAQVAAHLAELGVKIVGRNVSVNTSAGRRVVDILVEINGRLVNLEVKTGGAQRSTAQLTKDAAMAQGAKLVGKNAGDLVRQVRNIATLEVRLP